jgi:hypothetical protein
MKKNKIVFWQGKYLVENVNKFCGKINPIVYRSSWESKFCYFLDHHPNVKKWCYECLEIAYYNPLDKKMHRYYPDFYFEEENNKGNKRIFVVEVKPKTQIIPPKEPKSNRGRKRYLYEAKTYITNRLKWEAAEKYCDSKGYEFRIAVLEKVKDLEQWKVFSLKQI